ncbi:MAG: histidinol-phosphate transaminase [Chloroflexi bacterium]|nr:histidinol-phosphate transaminase [Chloroflexota bacterium]
MSERVGEISSAKRPVHGGIRPAQLRALGLEQADVLDFSASVSPLGPPVGLWSSLERVDLTAYPDPECLELREALADHHGISVDNILVGNGSTELIHLLARAYISESSAHAPPRCLQFSPTYGEYAGACEMGRADMLEIRAQREAGFSWDLDRAEAEIREREPAMVFLCNPNNPTGVYLENKQVSRLCKAAGAVDSLLVLDEAYINFVEDRWDALTLMAEESGPNLVLLRSMTKDYALTGLRLGYMVAAQEVVQRLAALQPDWSVNALAQVAGVVALDDEGYLPKARHAVNASKKFLTRELNEAGFCVLRSAANFLLVEVGDGAKWRERLMSRGVFVRDCASFGLPDCIRIGIRSMPDCQRLVEAVRLEMAKDGD